MAGIKDYENIHGGLVLNRELHGSLVKRIAGSALACFDRQFHKLFGEAAFDPLEQDGGDAAVDLLEELEKAGARIDRLTKTLIALRKGYTGTGRYGNAPLCQCTLCQQADMMLAKEEE